MEPVRIKLYGLVALTRRQYLRVQVLVFALTAVVMAAALVAVRVLPPPDPKTMPHAAVLVYYCLSLLRWVVPAVWGVEVLETFLVLRRFAREEARVRPPSAEEARASSPAGPVG